MNAKSLLVLGASALTALPSGHAAAEEAQAPYVRVADIEIDPAQLEAYRAALKEEVEASVRTDPGVLALYAVTDKDNPAHIFVFEIYADVPAYKAHLEAPEFKKYKTDTNGIVRSLKLFETVPIALSAKK